MKNHVEYPPSDHSNIFEILSAKYQVRRLPEEFLERCKRMGITDLKGIMTYWTCGE